MSDIISIRNAAILATVGKDCWHRDKAQRVLVSLRLKTSIEVAGENDDVLKTIDYGKIYKAVVDSLDGSKHPNLDVFTREAARIALKTGGGNSVHATVVLPNALLQADGVGFEVQDFKDGGTSDSTALFVKDLKLPCVIGVNRHERQAKQLVIVNLRFYDVDEEGLSDYPSSLKNIQAHIEASTYLTLEALVVSIAKVAFQDLGFSKLTVSAEKPNAYALMDGPGVEITRTKDSFKNAGNLLD